MPGPSGTQGRKRTSLALATEKSFSLAETASDCPRSYTFSFSLSPSLSLSLSLLWHGHLIPISNALFSFYGSPWLWQLLTHLATARLREGARC